MEGERSAACDDRLLLNFRRLLLALKPWKVRLACWRQRKLDVSEAHLQPVLIRVVNLQPNETFPRCVVVSVRHRHIVDPGPDMISQAFDAILVPRAKLESLLGGGIVREVLQPTASAFFVETSA